MTKIVYISTLLVISICVGYQGKAQLLQAGDLAVTNSSNMAPGNDPGTAFVLQIFKTSNTSQAAFGTTFVTAHSIPNYKIQRPNWVRDTLGQIFGITIDDQRNIYVARTSVYSTGNVFPTASNPNRKISPLTIWRIEATNGNHSVFATIPQTNINVDGAASIGNIKFYNGMIYATNQHDGMIYCYDANLTNQTTPLYTFDPGFDNTGTIGAGASGGEADYRQNLWGLSIRKENSGARLYYARLSPKQIWSVPLFANGSFDAANETMELNESILGGINYVYISDLAFSADQRNLLVAERNKSEGGGAHASRVFEIVIDRTQLPGSRGAISGRYSTGGKINGNYINSSGGISYSPTITRSNRLVACDTTIWATAHAIFVPSMTPDPVDGTRYTYGLQGIRHRQFTDDPSKSCINIDLDNEMSTINDKYYLGDVEVCDSILNCSNCQCGTWNPEYIIEQKPKGVVGLNEITFHRSHSQVTFKCGEIPAAYWFDNYKCNGDCQDSVVALIKEINAKYTLPMSLTVFNSLPKGSYTIIFTPFCGNPRQACPPDTLYVTIVCDPPTCCPSKQQLSANIKDGQAFFVNAGEGKYNSASIVLALNGTEPMSEIRINIEDFKLSSENPTCLNCRNYPITWGSLLNANVNGSPMVTAPGNSLGNASLINDNRELIYKPGSLIDIRNKELQFEMALPPLSEIDCCKIMVGFCIKVTFKDAQCRECVKLICVDPFVMEKTKTGGGGRGTRINTKTTNSNSNQ